MTNTKIRELVNENSFTELITSELYALIDEEIEKGDEMDCQLIDELVNAIEALENAESEKKNALILPLLFNDSSALAKRVRNKVNGKNTLMRLTAIAAAVAIFLSGTNQLLLNTEGTSLAQEFTALIDKISDVFTQSKIADDSTQESTTTPNEEITEQNNSEPTVTEPEIVSIGLITYGNFKTSYLWKEELNLTGLKVVAVYSDDTEKAISTKDCEISGFNSLKLGEQLITVKYNGFSAYFKVTVSKTEQNNAETRKITNIECKATGKDIVVPMGTENPAVYKNVKYRYVYSDGTFSPWTSCEDAKLISDYDSKLLDTVQVLTYQAPNGMKFTINVVVYDNTVAEEKVVTKLEVYKMPQAIKRYASNYNQYYTYVYSDCDFSEFQIKVHYDDRTNEIKKLADGEIKAFGTMSTERPSSYSGYTITFAYGDITLDFKYDVIIKPEIQSYSFDTDGIWECYYIDNAPEEFPVKSIVKARMTDSNDEIYLDVEVKGYDPNKIGYIELEVYYEGEYLGDFIGGYIYGDTGYAVTGRSLTNVESKAPVKYRPSVTLAKCVGGGKFQTYGDIKYELDDHPITDSGTYYEGTTNSELRASGITKIQCFCIDDATVYYTLSSDEYIKEFGTHKSEIYLYNVKKQDNGTYVKDGIAQDFSYSVTIKEKPSYYEFEAPDNIKINIQDIYTEFYDKVHVYAVYEDGRKEEVFDHYISRYLPSRATTSARLRIYMRSADWEWESRKDIYVYSEGYEDSFFITLKDIRQEYDNYYVVGTEKPSIQINFASAEQQEIEYVITTSTSQTSLKKWDIEGWDTSTPGEKEATIIYHSPIGDLKSTYKYVVLSEYYDAGLKITYNNGQEAYDTRYGFIDGTYKIQFIDKVGRLYDLSDYIISYSSSIYGEYYSPKITYTSPVDNKTYTVYENLIEKVGDIKSITAGRLDNGDVKITIETLYFPQSGTLKYQFKVYGTYLDVYADSKITEVIIPKEQWPENTSKAYYLTSYIVDNDSGEMFYSNEFPQDTLTV